MSRNNREATRSGRRFFRTTITLEIFSVDEPPPEGMDLEALVYEMTNGEWTGAVTGYAVAALTADEVEQEVKNIGSPDFFDWVYDE